MNEYEKYLKRVRTDYYDLEAYNGLLKLVEKNKNGIYISNDKAKELLEALEEIELHIGVNNAMLYGDAIKRKEDKIMYAPFNKIRNALDCSDDDE